MLDHLIDYHLWGRLPGKHQTLTILMRVADFLGKMAILQNVAQQLGVPVETGTQGLWIMRTCRFMSSWGNFRE